MKIPVVNLSKDLVRGITVQMPDSDVTDKESYFEWYRSSLVAGFNTMEISGGILKAWHHEPEFLEIEIHIDAEMFYFLSGVSLMLFMDTQNAAPLMDSAQIVRISAGSQIIIPAGKGHYVPVAEGDEPIIVVVVAPQMRDIKILLPEPIIGIV